MAAGIEQRGNAVRSPFALHSIGFALHSIGTVASAL
jgi:hypothetical protein